LSTESFRAYNRLHQRGTPKDDFEYQRERNRNIDVEKTDELTSSEVAYRAVLAFQESGKQAEREAARGATDTSSTRSTPMIVWGALAGLFFSAFQVDPDQPTTLLTIPAAGTAIGAGLGWTIGKVFRLVFLTIPGMLFGGLRKLAKGEREEPPA
jgi:hypothetical protein